MQEKSIFKNYIYNIILTVSNLIFPLVVFYYVSRVIGPDGIGKVNFASTIASYFILLGTFGINTYGVRIIARYRDDLFNTRKNFNELFVIELLISILSLILYILFILTNSKTRNETSLFLLYSLAILLNIFSFEWFFQGLEKYKYITLRSLIIKIISTILIFLFIKSKRDYLLYAIFLIFGNGANNLFNLYYANKIIGIDFKNISIKQHFPLLVRFAIISFTVSLYSGLDKILLGYITNEYYIGLYIPAEKIARLSLSFIVALSSVLYPKVANIFYNGTEEELQTIISKAMHAVLVLAVPFTVGIEILADYLILLISGSLFISSIPTLRIQACIIIPVAIANVAGIQALIAVGKEKKYLLSILVATIFFVIIAFLLIPNMKQNGAAIALFAAEFIGAGLELIFARKYFRGMHKENWLYNIIISSIIMGIIILIIKSKIKYSFLSTIFIIGIGGITYFLLLFLFKDFMIHAFIQRAINNSTNKK